MSEFGPAGFSVAYSPTGSNHQGLPAKNLATSLEAFADLFESVDSIIGGKTGTVQLTYEATRDGSVECIFEVLELVTPYAAIVSQDFRTYANLIRELVVGSKGLFAVLPQLRESEGQAEIRSSAGITKRLPDGTEMTIDKDVAKVLAERAPRELIFATLAPMESGDCKNIRLNNGAGTVIDIDEGNFELYRPPGPEVRRDETTQEMTLTVMGVVFEGDAKWKMKIEPVGKGISCKVTDARYLAEVKDGLRFGKGDVIDAKVRSTWETVSTKARRSGTHEITHIHSHRGPSFDWDGVQYRCTCDDDQATLSL